MKNGNFVAKYDWQVNKAKTFKDRKKAMKKGYLKHKNVLKAFNKNRDSCLCLFSLLKF